MVSENLKTYNNINKNLKIMNYNNDYNIQNVDSTQHVWKSYGTSILNTLFAFNDGENISYKKI